MKLSLVFLYVSYLLFAPPLYADSDEDSVEYKIKAAYLYNFTKFITWPEDQSDRFNLCILGHDPFGTLIAPIEQRTVATKPIQVIRLHDINALKNISKTKSCHILFVSAALDTLSTLQEIKALFKHFLIVGESQNFVADGGMIGFISENSRIKLQINLQTFKDSELKISAKLLEVAEIIQGDRHD